jgi:hypothetical protein
LKVKGLGKYYKFSWRRYQKVLYIMLSINMMKIKGGGKNGKG